MPELPEVETVVRLHRDLVVGRTIHAFVSRWPRQLTPGPAAFKRAVVSRRISHLGRRAKWIVANLDGGGHLLIHLRMSGRLEWRKDAASRPEPAHARAYFDFDNGSRLYFCDARKFGRLMFLADLKVLDAELGVEPLGAEFTVKKLADLLSARRRALKPLLLDQRIIAGVGNIYADESLFRAGLHPLRHASRLKSAEVQRLHAAIVQVLTLGIQHNGTMIDWIYPDGNMQDHLQVYGRTGKPCLACGTPIVGLRVGQRGTHVCPQCQPRRGLRRPVRRAASINRRSDLRLAGREARPRRQK